MTGRYGEITIRELGERDGAALAHLAQRDSARIPAAPVIGALADNRLLAARSLASGEVIADPWARTDHLTALLEKHASLLGAANGRRGRRKRRRARAALAGSPPGAGGRLLDLRAPLA